MTDPVNAIRPDGLNHAELASKWLHRVTRSSGGSRKAWQGVFSLWYGPRENPLKPVRAPRQRQSRHADPEVESQSMKSENCRSCGSAALTLIYDFGVQPLAGEYPTVAEDTRPAQRYPLDLTECADCGLWQVTNLPPIEEVFHEEYRYSSSTVPDLVRHFTGYADFLTQRLAPQSSILEFGCNDGVLLAQLAERGFACVGVDASDNVASLARSKGLDVRTGFLTPDFVEYQGLAGQFDLVTCSNVFAHIHDIAATTLAVKRLLKPGGLFNIEVHDGGVLANEAQFDTIYHEHLTYFTEATLRHFTALQGFEFVECHSTAMHGGGLRFSARLLPGGEAALLPPEPAPIDAEHFSRTIARCRAEIVGLFAEHGPIDGYGAAGRAQMFINMTGTAEYFARVFDDSPFRQDRFIVGTNVPILPYRGEKSACCAILAWNYAPTIAARVEADYAAVVTLLPELKHWKN
jgi:SAM-dependent methyltransferase